MLIGSGIVVAGLSLLPWIQFRVNTPRRYHYYYAAREAFPFGMAGAIAVGVFLVSLGVFVLVLGQRVGEAE